MESGEGPVPMEQSATLVGGDVVLRRPVPVDIEGRLACGRDAEFVRMCGGDAGNVAPLRRADVEGWYASMAEDSLSWVIEYQGRYVGSARLHSLDAENARARYAIGIHDNTVWGLGIGTAATRLVLGYAFDVLRLHRVDLRVLSFNERAIRCYEKCGFVREGIEREGALIAGAWQTDVMMSILEYEYRGQEDASRR